MQQRYYDPVIGRFYSNDPVGFTASNPMMFNRYAYANNNPYKFVDPDGRTAIIDKSETEETRNILLSEWQKKVVFDSEKDSAGGSLPAKWNSIPADNNNQPSSGGVLCDSICLDIAQLTDRYLVSQQNTAEFMAQSFILAAPTIAGSGYLAGVYATTGGATRTAFCLFLCEASGVYFNTIKGLHPELVVPKYTEASFVFEKVSRYMKPKMRVPNNP